MLATGCDATRTAADDFARVRGIFHPRCPTVNVSSGLCQVKEGGDTASGYCARGRLKLTMPASERLSLDVKVQLDCHKDVDWHVSDMAGCKSPLPNGRDRFLVAPAWIE